MNDGSRMYCDVFITIQWSFIVNELP
jgi:hypothetical protein